MSIGLSKASELKTLAIIVNYRSRDLTLDAVDSVLKSESIGPVDIVVVDNSEDKDEAAILRSHLPAEVRLLVSPENLGFGRACNLAFEQFHGELILLINPDAKLLPGCLFRLQKTIFLGEKTAAVSPQVFWDEGLQFYLPPSYPPALLQWQSFLVSWGPRRHIETLMSGLWRSYALKIWRALRPVRVNNLSGGLVLLRKEAVRRVGGLFDPQFFLYLEDTDLFLRLRKAGYTLIIEPRAWAVHRYDQCGREEWERKRAMMAESYGIFLEKHSSVWKSGIKRALERIRLQVQADDHNVPGPRFFSPFVLTVPPHCHDGWLFEWSPNHTFIPSAGRLGKGPRMDFNQKYWDMLTPGQYFGRLGNPMLMGRYSDVVSWLVEK
jgi:GT2 family glycosyltransferase